MASMSKRRNVLGVFVDGLDIKLAHLSIKGKRVTVNELKSATLVSKIEERQHVEATMASLGEGGVRGTNCVTFRGNCIKNIISIFGESIIQSASN